MRPITQQEIVDYVEANIQTFHQRRLDKLQELKLVNVVKRKNPYLFKAKNINAASEFVKTILDAFLSSQEEGIFGDFLEELAIFICGQVYDGRKSSAVGIDLEFEKDNIRYIVSIKSGPNWGNSSQIAKMMDNFGKAKRILRTNTSLINVIAVNGCCYGKNQVQDKGDYLKLCGQRFWEFISGDEDLYTEIIGPLGHRAKEKNEQFSLEYAKVLSKFTGEFITKFCDADGSIRWEDVVRLNSGSTR